MEGYTKDVIAQAARIKKQSDDALKAISGARIVDIDSKEAQQHAERYYGLVRSMKTDVAKVAKTTGNTQKQIRAIKQYLFFDEHDLGGEKAERVRT